MIDWDLVVLGPLEKVFGEPITYVPKIGAAISITGIFDEAYRELEPAGGSAFTTETPMLGIRLKEVPSPKQGDQFIVPRLGLRYVVKDVRLDSHGCAKLPANEMGRA